jgi:putative DNA primase/helicase
MDNDATRTDRPSRLSGPLNNRFLYLREDKAPVSWDMYALDDTAGCKTVGVLIPDQYVVVDVDNMEQAEKLMRLVIEENIKCQIMQTTRGKHFWFTSTETLKNSTKVMTGIGIHVDYRSWGKQSQVCVRMNGEWREWLTEYEWGELDALPRWLRPLLQSKWKFYEMGEGDGRNQALFDYQIMLSKRGYSKQEAFDVLRLINTYIFKETMPNREIDTICRDEAYPDPETTVSQFDPDAPWFGPKGGFLHNIMGDEILKEMNIVRYHQQFYVYENGCHRVGDNDVPHKIEVLFPTSTMKQRGEVLDYIRIMSHLEKPTLHEYIINQKNGRLDLKKGERMSHTPEAHDFQQINASYDPTAYSEPLEKMLRKVFQNDQQLYDLFEEMMGYCLIKNCRMQKIFIFFGDGNNGKSTLLRVICNFIGDGNYSTLSLQDLEKTFRPAELENKLVNLGDDIPSTTIKDSSLLKSLSTGERVLVERKNKNPFILKNYAKLIFTTNKMPPVNDKSFGFYRRLVLIPLDAKFSSSDPDFDPDIEEKVTSDEAMSYLLNMAIRGFKRMMKHGFTESDKVKKAVETYKQKSSHTLTWTADNGIDEGYLLLKSTRELYYEFKNWCADEGIENVPKQQTFTSELEKQFNFMLSLQKREKGTTNRVKFFLKINE